MAISDIVLYDRDRHVGPQTSGGLLAMTSFFLYFRIDPLSRLIAAFAILFYVLTAIYSREYMRGKQRAGQYYICLLLTLAASLGAIFADNMIVFIVFWGFLGLLLYLLINFGRKERTSETAKKALITVGGTDVLMVFGIALAWRLSGSIRMSEIHIGMTFGTAAMSYLCLAAGALAKAGSMPFHSWVPDTAEDAPVPVTAYLPASLDKLLGIYLLARLSLGIFRLSPALNSVLMMVGGLTIIAAVMMALVQHDLKRLLGYHAVSQVGYMVLGIGTGNPVGIAGGLFHMLNHAIYKSCLFFCGGNIEKNAGTTNLENLGGLAKQMPVTFTAFLVAALAISGVPPLNGFASKWMIYQGVIEAAHSGSRLCIVWLVAALFGSALTLASFMKVVHAVFLGRQSARLAKKNVREVETTMGIPPVILAFLCVLFGVFAAGIPLRLFILPSLGYPVFFPGVWNAGLATALLLAGILIGFFIYWLGVISKTRRSETFIGGESLESNPEMRISGTEFYHTIRDLPGMKPLYGMAERRRFDPYDICSRATGGVYRIVSHLHNGILPTYLSWCLLGATILFVFLHGAAR